VIQNIKHGSRAETFKTVSTNERMDHIGKSAADYLTYRKNINLPSTLNSCLNLD